MVEGIVLIDMDNNGPKQERSSKTRTEASIGLLCQAAAGEVYNFNIEILRKKILKRRYLGTLFYEKDGLRLLKPVVTESATDPPSF